MKLLSVTLVHLLIVAVLGGGIIMLMAMVGIIQRSEFPGSKAETIEMIGLYWHFVDIVWIVIFTLVYLIPV